MCAKSLRAVENAMNGRVHDNSRSTVGRGGMLVAGWLIVMSAVDGATALVLCVGTLRGNDGFCTCCSFHIARRTPRCKGEVHPSSNSSTLHIASASLSTELTPREDIFPLVTSPGHS